MYADSRVLTLDSVEAGEGQNKSKSAKQKSLFKLLRSTRQSTAQSVVHRNGDIIIMKGGKIVSVRRAGEGREGSPLLDRIKTFNDTTREGMDLMSGLAGPGHVMFGIVCEGVAVEDEGLVGRKDYDNASEGSDDVFSTADKVSSAHTAEDTSGLRDSGIGNSSLENSDVLRIHKKGQGDEVHQNLENDETGDGTKSLSSHVNFISNHVENCPCYTDVTNELSDPEISEVQRTDAISKNKNSYYLNSSADKSAAASTPLHSGGVVIHVNDDNDVLSIMPLTPHTREHLTKSDFYIAQNNPEGKQSHGKVLILRSLHPSHSSETIFRNPHTLQRFPSLECLDPPVQLSRSQSNISMHSFNRHYKEKLKSPSSNSLSKSHVVKSDSKSSCLPSSFSPKKKITQV